MLRRIAAGGMGAVFEVVHVETQRRRALKVMLPELLANRQLRERFQMEARITANVDTEYIVDVFDAGIDEATGMPFLVMELLNGEDLAKVLEKTGPLSPQLVVTYLRQVASALDKTHAAGIIHRDLKPENLFLTHREDGTPRVKILDFGISKVVTEAQTGGAMNATRGLGTPMYMAPEQVLAQTMGPGTDIYALGLIAYTLLVGVSYWQREADTFDNPITFVVHTSKGATDSAVGRAAHAGHSLPASFDAWFRRATHLDPACRFRSASELTRELALVLGVANPTFSGAQQGPDSTGAFQQPSTARSPSAAGGIGARTAPGTEFDRQSTLSGSARKSQVVSWLVLGGAALAASVVVGVLALRSGGVAAIASGEAPPAVVLAVPLRASAALAPSAPANGVSSAVAAVPVPVTEANESPPSAPSASAKVTAHVKAPSTSNKSAPAKAPLSPSHVAPAPKYTRD